METSEVGDTDIAADAAPDRFRNFGIAAPGGPKLLDLVADHPDEGFQREGLRPEPKRSPERTLNRHRLLGRKTPIHRRASWLSVDSCIMQVSMDPAIRKEAEAFLAAWLEARRLVQSLNFNRFQQEGLSATQFILLTMLGESDRPLGAAALARRLNVGVTTTMRTADTLIGRDLIAKRRDPDDYRRWLLDLTPSGRAAHARMQAQFIDHVSDAFAAMPADLRSGLLRGLQAFNREAGK